MSTSDAQKQWEEAVLRYMQNYDVATIRTSVSEPELQELESKMLEFANNCTSKICTNFARMMDAARDHPPDATPGNDAQRARECESRAAQLQSQLVTLEQDLEALRKQTAENPTEAARRRLWEHEKNGLEGAKNEATFQLAQTLDKLTQLRETLDNLPVDEQALAQQILEVKGSYKEVTEKAVERAISKIQSQFTDAEEQAEINCTKNTEKQVQEATSSAAQHLRQEVAQVADAKDAEMELVRLDLDRKIAHANKQTGDEKKLADEAMDKQFKAEEKLVNTKIKLTKVRESLNAKVSKCEKDKEREASQCMADITRARESSASEVNNSKAEVRAAEAKMKHCETIQDELTECVKEHVENVRIVRAVREQNEELERRVQSAEAEQEHKIKTVERDWEEMNTQKCRSELTKYRTAIERTWDMLEPRPPGMREPAWTLQRALKDASCTVSVANLESEDNYACRQLLEQHMMLLRDLQQQVVEYVTNPCDRKVNNLIDSYFDKDSDSYATFTANRGQYDNYVELRELIGSEAALLKTELLATVLTRCNRLVVSLEELRDSLILEMNADLELIWNETRFKEEVLDGVRPSLQEKPYSTAVKQGEISSRALTQGEMTSRALQHLYATLKMVVNRSTYDKHREATDLLMLIENKEEFTKKVLNDLLPDVKDYLYKQGLDHAKRFEAECHSGAITLQDLINTLQRFVDPSSYENFRGVTYQEMTNE